MIPEMDLQERQPKVLVSLSRVGVTNVHRIIRIKDNSKENLFYSQIDLFADLPPEKMGLHMSRFSESLNEAIEETVIKEALDIESLCERICQNVLRQQGGQRAEVRIKAKYPKEKITPVSRLKTQEIHSIIAIAVCHNDSCKRLIGVEATGLTVCPCAQEMIFESVLAKLLDNGYSKEEAKRILKLFPLASHNQKGEATLLIGSPGKIEAEELVDIVEGSMSSEIYDLLKRPDELHIVEKAHLHPRFVEDVVREMLIRVISRFTELPDNSFVLAKQKNLESIHNYDVFSERYGTLDEIRKEILYRGHVSRHTTMEEWLE
jgi:MptA/FolE2 family GTP cyclohydrolase